MPAFFRGTSGPGFFPAAHTGRGQTPEIQRESIDSSCNTPQQEYITDAVTRAYGDLTAILPLVRERPVPEHVSNALWLAFRNNSVATADNVLFNIRRLQEVITSARFSCATRSGDPECGENTYGHAPRGMPGGVIVLCAPRFFDMSIFAQSRGVIHEAAHMYLSMRDRGYFYGDGENQCTETAHPTGNFDPGHEDSGTAGDHPSYRLENADAYACFVHFLRYWPRERLRTRSAAFRGDQLAIAADDITSDVYTEATTPQLHAFRITGMPANSGFRFRWQLRANGTDYTPAAMGSAAAGAFSEDNRAVYIPTSLRRILQREGVRRATLICETALYGPAPGDRFPAPVISTRQELNIIEGREPADF
ncbi:hypothetical protein GCM10009415_48070 [Chitinophaga japonensis]